MYKFYQFGGRPLATFLLELMTNADQNRLSSMAFPMLDDISAASHIINHFADGVLNPSRERSGRLLWDPGALCVCCSACRAGQDAWSGIVGSRYQTGGLWIACSTRWRMTALMKDIWLELGYAHGCK